MFKSFFQIDSIELNPSIKEDEFIFKYEDEPSDSFSLLNFNTTPQINFINSLFKNSEEEEIGVKDFFVKDKFLEKKTEGKKMTTVEPLTNITDKIVFPDDTIIQISNLVNGKTDEEILILNDETIKNTDQNTLLGKKRKKFNEEKKTDKNKNSNCGRKKKGSTEKRNHTKYKEDNMIAKIKNFIFNSILHLLNHSYIQTNPKFIITKKNILGNKFLKINPEITHSIKKKNNLYLLNTKIKNILSNKISSKYLVAGENHNEILIQKVYNEKKETNIIKILELTFRELLNVFRGTINTELEKKINEIDGMDENFYNMEIFLEIIKKQEIDKKENEEFITNYVNYLKKLCMSFEEWFSAKKGRSRIEK